MHYLTCTTGDQLKTRHEIIVKASHEMVSATSRHSATRGLENVLEGYSNSRGNRLVLDQLVKAFSRDGADHGFDYAVCHPCSSSYLSSAKDSPLGAAKKRAEQKVNKYDVACRNHDIAFNAPVLEVFGAWSDDMVKLAKSCAALVQDSLPDGTTTTWTADSFSAYHQQRIGIALQRANAKAIRLRAARDYWDLGLG